jgi:very-short-patch-repair endonuclease
VSSSQSPTASAFSRKTFNPDQMALMARLNEAIVRDPVFKGVEMMGEKALPRAEFTRDGKQKHFYVDIALRDPRTGLRYALEVMGEGSKSDDPERHAWLLENGFIPLYFDNQDCRHSMKFVMRRIRQTLVIMRTLLAG